MAPPPSSSTSDPNSIKLALAIALLRLKKGHQPSDSEAQCWKTKAKQRKREIIHLREELKQLEDGRHREDLPQIAACRCHFFDDCGDLRKDGGNGGDRHWIDEVLRRRFLRLVRWKERRKRVEGSLQRRNLFEFNNENETEQLCTSIDFLVELSGTISVNRETDAAFSTLSHQATDFILASLKKLLSSPKDSELIEETVNGLIMRLTRRMCDAGENNGSFNSDSDAQFSIQHLIRKLAHEPFIGQRVMLFISQKISIVADSLLVMDPFDNAFPGMHGNMYMMIQLIEFLILDSLHNWTDNEDFDTRIFEEWVRSILQACKGLGLLECRNTLYLLYMERVIGELVKQVSPLAHQGKIDADILSSLIGYDKCNRMVGLNLELTVVLDLSNTRGSSKVKKNEAIVQKLRKLVVCPIPWDITLENYNASPRAISLAKVE